MTFSHNHKPEKEKKKKKNLQKIVKNPSNFSYLLQEVTGEKEEISPILSGSLTPSDSSDWTKTPSPRRNNPY